MLPEKTNRSVGGLLSKRYLCFSAQQLPPFIFPYLLHPEGFHSGELRRAALQEGSTRPQRTGLALLLNNPVRL